MAKCRRFAYGWAGVFAAYCSLFTLGAGADPTEVVPATSALVGTAAIDDVNYGGLWWRAPGGSEDGWGINFAHQGDVIFATWFTYDDTGSALWMVMTAYKSAEGVYTGTLYRTAGPPFSATPFNPAAVARVPVGTGTLAFGDANDGTFNYTVNGITQSKPITRQVFGPLPTCTFGAQQNLALATNYQDLWWNPAESGWGLNLTQQGNTIFAAWFTYDEDGTPLWLTATANPALQARRYAGTLYRSSGPAFYTVPFSPVNVTKMPVGTVVLNFADGNNGTFSYTLFGVAQEKNITRQVFQVPGTVCQ